MILWSLKFSTCLCSPRGFGHCIGLMTWFMMGFTRYSSNFQRNWSPISWRGWRCQASHTSSVCWVSIKSLDTKVRVSVPGWQDSTCIVIIVSRRSLHHPWLHGEMTTETSAFGPYWILPYHLFTWLILICIFLPEINHNCKPNSFTLWILLVLLVNYQMWEEFGSPVNLRLVSDMREVLCGFCSL